MQENRSFDHYFGVMRGVRGFGDPASGDAARAASRSGTRPTAPRSCRRSAPSVGDNLALDLHRGSRPQLGRDASDVQRRQLGPVAAGQDAPPAWRTWSARDLPFHYALADAFTICDAYHCSMLGPTDPNRYYMWTGWDGNDGKGGGPVIANDEIGYGWQTYPERLQAAGISWKIYQDIGDGLDAAGVWGCDRRRRTSATTATTRCCTSSSTRTPTPGSPLYDGARTGTDVDDGGGFFDILASRRQPAASCRSVSWIVAPEAYTEHPAWPAGYGAWYTAQVLNALTSDPEVWSKTALLITFDENDGFFDHVVGAVPATSATSPASRPCRSTTSCSTASPERPAAPTGSSVRMVSASACRCSSSRRGARAAGSARRRSTTRR